MIQSLVGLLLLIYSLALLAGCVFVWVYMIVQLAQKEPILRARPAPPANWGLVDVLGGMAGVIFLIIFFSSFVPGPRPASAESMTLSQQSGLMWAQMFAQSTVCLLILLAIQARGGRKQIFGDSQSVFLNDVKIGVAAFAALCIPVLILQMTLAYLVPYEHPLIDMMLESPQSNIIIPVVVSAVIIAPLTEEFAFRLVLQGWLEDVLAGRLPSGVDILLGRIRGNDLIPSSPTPNASWLPPSPESDTTEQAPSLEPVEVIEAASPMLDRPPLMVVPIVVSSLLFAGMHLGQGAAPVPLFFLALGLGYVYQKTRTLTPSLVVHMLLNGQSMLLLLLQLFFGEGLTEPPV